MFALEDTQLNSGDQDWRAAKAQKEVRIPLTFLRAASPAVLSIQAIQSLGRRRAKTTAAMMWAEAPRAWMGALLAAKILRKDLGMRP